VTGARLRASRLHNGLRSTAREHADLSNRVCCAKPDIAARVANLYAEEFIKLHFETRQQMREKARELLKRELEGSSSASRVREDVGAYAQDHDIPVTEPDNSLVRQKLSTIGGHLTDARPRS